MGPTLLRLLLAVLLFHHASHKLFGWFGDVPVLTDWTSPSFATLPGVLIMVATLSELIFSLLLAFGLFTRIAAFGGFVLMGSAAGLIYWQGSFPEMQLPGILAVISLSLVFSGAGLLSLDRAISRQLLPTVG
ncbi:MAG: DoxX family membrane protein [Chthoniobacterales bacterium]